MVKRAHIHHRDGNPLNNPPDGSNWEVLCVRCHMGIPTTSRDGSGINISVTFAPWKRAEIIESRNFHCERCCVEVSPQKLKKDYGEVIMSKGNKYIVVDEYTVDLLQQVVNQGKASNLSEAVGKSAASYLGIRYKSKEERRLEQDAAHTMEMGRMVNNKED